MRVQRRQNDPSFPFRLLAEVATQILEVVERVALSTVPTPENLKYLQTKRDRMGHLIDLPAERSAQ